MENAAFGSSGCLQIRMVRRSLSTRMDQPLRFRKGPSDGETWRPLSESSSTSPTDILDEAYRRGVSDGRKAAEEELLRTQQTSEKALMLHAEALAQSVKSGFATLLGRIESDALRFALAVAERIVKREVRLDKDLVLRQIREAVKRIMGTDSIKLRVNPEDESVVRHHRSAILSTLESVREVIIEGDTSIDRGGCIIESTSGNVDACLETQLRQVEAALFGASAVERKGKR